MIINISCFNENAIPCKLEDKIVSNCIRKLFLAGHKINKASFYGHNFSFAKNDIEASLNLESAHIIFISNVQTLKNELYNFISSKTGGTLIKNAQVENLIKEQYRLKNLPMPQDVDVDWLLPDSCKIITNSLTQTQGLITKIGLCHLIVLPYEFETAITMTEKFILPYLSEHVKINYKTQTYKTFGISDENIKVALADLIKNKDKISIVTFQSLMEVDIVIKAQSDNIELENYSQKVYDRLNKFIYAEEDISVCKAIFRLLQLNHLSLSIAESITGGNVCNNLIKNNDGASEIIKQGIVAYSNDAKINLLNIKKETIDSFGDVSVEVTYDMALGLLKINPNDIVVATTGYAGKTKNGDPKGLCYIAIGDSKAVHVYKNIFAGSREDIIDSATKATYFYLIKKLRKNDFHFSQTTV